MDEEYTNINDPELYNDLQEEAEASNASASGEGTAKEGGASSEPGAGVGDTEGAGEAQGAAEEGLEEGKPEASKDPKAPTKVDEEALFSDESLATPEGLKNAREYIKAQSADARRQRKEAQDTYFKTKKFEKKIQDRDAESRQLHDNTRAIHQQVHSLLTQARTGGAKAVFETIGFFMGGKNGAQAYEEMSNWVVGQTPERNRIEELEQTIAQMEQKLTDKFQTQQQQRELQQRQAQLDSQISQARQRMFGVAQQEPRLANAIRYNPNMVVDELARIKVNAYDQGQALTDEQAVAILTESLTGQTSSAPGQATGNPEAGRETSFPRPAVAPKPPPTSLTSSVLTAQSRTRALSEEERLDQAANDPEFWKELGLEGLA